MSVTTKKDKNTPRLRFPEFDAPWNGAEMSSIAKVYDGTHQTPSYTDSGVKFVSVENIGDISNTEKFISEEAFKKDFKHKPRKGDILMTRITAGVIGATALVENDEPLGYYVSLAMIRPDELLNSSYLSTYINTDYFKHELHKRIIHVAFPKKINLSDIGKCLVSYPEKNEQLKISDFVGSIDAWLGNLRQQKIALETYKRGMMQKLFTQQVRFKDGNGKDFSAWQQMTLADVSSKFNSGVAAGSLEGNEGEFAVFGASGLYKHVDFYQEEESYIAVVKDGSGVGRTKVYPGQSSVIGTLNVIRAKQGHDLYFVYLLISQLNLQKYVIGGAIPHIYYKDYKREKVMVPSLAEQQKISDFIRSLEQSITTKEEEIAKVEQWKKGLMQKMFV